MKKNSSDTYHYPDTQQAKPFFKTDLTLTQTTQFKTSGNQVKSKNKNETENLYK